MARPQGNKKRKAASKPAPPPQPKRGRGGKGTRAGDIYEADDSDPDEIKNSKRYDNVENYEYEMPSDFEDEEIDEELAFTAEDKKKFGAWFDDHQGGGSEGGLSDEDELQAEDEDADADHDSDLDILYSDEELPSKGRKASAASQDEEEDDLLRQLDDDGDEAEDEDEEEQDDQEPADGAKYKDMLAAVLGGGAQDPKAKRRLRQSVVHEAYPEAEFGINPGSAATGELSLADLMHGLAGERKQLPAAIRKELAKMAGGSGKSQVVAAPLPRTIKERTARQAGYQITSTEVTKWQPIVKANREAPTLQFTSARDEVPRISTTAAIVAQHTPETAMENEVAALLEAAGAATATAVAAAEEALSMKGLSVEEARERRGRLAKLRSLLFYHELKAKRLKNIKSKEYHKKAKAAKTRKERALLGGSDPAADGSEDEAQRTEREERERAEFDRAKERLTLKHRNTSRWARRALKRGATIMDAGTKAAVSEQLRLGEALRRRIDGPGEGDGSSTEASDMDADYDGSEGDEAAAVAGGGRGMTSKAKALALDILAGTSDPLAAGGDEVPKKGLFALPFMARALEKKRQAALEEASALLHDLEQEQDGDELAGGDAGGLAVDATATTPGQKMASGRRSFGAPGGAAGGASREEEEEQGIESDVEEDADAKLERLRQQVANGGVKPAKQASKGQQQAASKHFKPTAADQADLDKALGVQRSNASVTLSSVAAAAGGGGGKGAGQQQQQFMPSKKFSGPKPGYVYKKGSKGLGYYLDAPPAVPATNGKGPANSQLKQQAPPAKPLTPAAPGGNLKPPAAAASKLPSAAPTSKGNPAASKSKVSKVADVGAGGDSDSDGGDGVKEGMVAVKGHKELISMAFAGDDVEAEFAADKAAEVVAELPHIEEPSTLPGWGAWADQQRDPKWMRDAKAKAQRERDKAASSRADTKLQFVVLSEKYDRKAMTKYTVPAVPFPYNDKDTYERSIRQPLGRQYNPDASFRDLTRPAVLKSTGVIINPIKFSKPLAKQATELTHKAAKSKVLTVAGGVMKKPKKANH